VAARLMHLVVGDSNTMSNEDTHGCIPYLATLLISTKHWSTIRQWKPEPDWSGGLV